MILGDTRLFFHETVPPSQLLHPIPRSPNPSLRHWNVLIVLKRDAASVSSQGQASSTPFILSPNGTRGATALKVKGSPPRVQPEPPGGPREGTGRRRTPGLPATPRTPAFAVPPALPAGGRSSPDSAVSFHMASRGLCARPSLSPLQTRYMAGSMRRSREAPGPDVSVPASPRQLLPGLRVRPLPALYRQLVVSGVSVALPAPGAPELTPHWRLRGYLDGFEAHPPGGPLGAGAPGRSASCRDLKAPLLEAVPGLHSSPCPRNGSTAPRVCRAPSQHPPLCLRAKWTAVCSSSKFKN